MRKFSPLEIVCLMAFLFTAAAAVAENPRYNSATRPTRPVTLWQPDDSDPEMLLLLNEIKARGCSKPIGERCTDNENKYIEGGDRFARYLIDQYERSMSGGFDGSAIYLRRAAHTRSDTAHRYFRETILGGSAPAIQVSHAMDAVAISADERNIDLAFQAQGILKDPQERLKAIYAISIISKARGVTVPYSVEFLKSIERDAAEDVGIRKAAFQGLNQMEDAGLATPRSRPQDLEAERKSVQRQLESLRQGGGAQR